VTGASVDTGASVVTGASDVTGASVVVLGGQGTSSVVTGLVVVGLAVVGLAVVGLAVVAALDEGAELVDESEPHLQYSVLQGHP